MIKQSADNKPKPINRIAPGKWHVNYNIEAFTDEATDKTMWQFDYVEVPDLNRGAIVNAIVRRRYTESDEFSILRKKQAGIEQTEFEAYNEYVENVKSIVEQIISNQ